MPDTPPRSLNTGCGEFPEHDLLAALWHDWLHVGIDIERHNLPRPHPCIAFVQADSAALPFACGFSLIIIRHPDLDKYSERWQVILRNASSYVVCGGVLLVTVYALHERDFAAQYITMQPLELNENALSAPDLTGHDRFVLAYVK